MRPTTANDDNVFDFQALLHPGTVFEHPKDVVGHPSLTLAEKRAILASWGRFGNRLMSRVAGSGSTEGARQHRAILEVLFDLDGGPRHPGSSGRDCLPPTPFSRISSRPSAWRSATRCPCPRNPASLPIRAFHRIILSARANSAPSSSWRYIFGFSSCIATIYW
jgi:hypothetical protein